MTQSIALTLIHNAIERLSLPAFHPRAFPIAERRTRYLSILRDLSELYDYSHIDELAYGQLTCRALAAYVHGGL